MSEALALTGVGLLTAAGEGTEPLLAALARGESRLAPLPEPVGRGLRHGRGGRFPAALVEEAGPDRALTAALRAARAALAQAGLAAGPRVALAVGSGLGPSERLEGPQEPGAPEERASPAALARELAGALGLEPALARTFAVTCLSSWCALEHARAALLAGRAEAVLVLGVETLSRTIQAGFSALGALADDGFLLGEAACALVLEREATARARGASPRQRLLAQAMRVDGAHLTTPDPGARGLAAAIDAALAGSGPAPERLLLTAPASPGYAAQYERALGARWGPQWGRRASTWEAVTGHCLGASTAVGVAFAAARPAGVTLLLSVGFGGQSGATLLAAPEAP